MRHPRGGTVTMTSTLAMRTAEVELVSSLTVWLKKSLMTSLQKDYQTCITRMVNIDREQCNLGMIMALEGSAPLAPSNWVMVKLAHYTKTKSRVNVAAD